jgi:hypothetical protein
METGFSSILLVMLFDEIICSLVMFKSHLELFHGIVGLTMLANKLNEFI